MARKPCSCDHSEYRGVPFVAGMCRFCWLYHNQRNYQRKWGGVSASPPPTGGPGTELKAILASVGIVPKLNCGCEAMARRMDDWGPQGCRANRQEIVAFLRKKQRRMSWGERLTLAAQSFATGLILHVNPLDTVNSILDEAIRRAEAKE